MAKSSPKLNEFASAFEEEVRDFLRDTLGFSDVNGGPTYHLAPKGKFNQIDACGRYGDTLFVFQCTAAGKTTNKNMRDKILENRERFRIVLQSYNEKPEYSNCKQVVFFFATKKIILVEDNSRILEDGQPQIHQINESVIEYYIDLHAKIGKYATFNFLSDFRVYPAPADQLVFTAIRSKLKEYKVFSFFAPAKALAKYSYVARRRALRETFYQRMLEKKRISNIHSFLEKGGIFPTNIILSIKKDSSTFVSFGNDCQKGVSIGNLVIKGGYDALWVIDGQHRLYSSALSSSDNLLACLAFERITVEKERSFFLEINKEQKPIQPDLIWDLEGQAHPNSPRGIISNIVRKLNDDSPFRNSIYIPVNGPKAGKPINMAAFCLGILNAKLTSNLLPNLTGKFNPLYDDDPLRMIKRTSNTIQKYFETINEWIKSNDQRQFISGNAGIPIMLYLLEPIISRIERIPATSDLNNYARVIEEYFSQHFHDPKSLKSLKDSTTSESARKTLAKEIGRTIRINLGDKKFWPKMEESDLVGEIIKIERIVGKLIKIKLSGITSSWYKHRIPPDVYQSILKKATRDGTDLEENFDLGDEIKIIKQNNNWEGVFSDIFITKKGFNDLKELELAFMLFSKIRNPAVHGKSTYIDPLEYEKCSIYIRQMIQILPMNLDNNDSSIINGLDEDNRS